MGKKGISPKLIAHRYATALYELAKESKAVTPVLSDLVTFSVSLAQTPAMVRALSDPKIDLSQKHAALDALTKKGKAHKISAQFLKVVVQENRFDIYNEIVTQFKAVYDTDQNIRHVTAVTATQLNKKQQDVLETHLKDALGASAIDLQMTVDPTILGGILIRFGSTLVDDTIKNKLNRISQKMKGTA